LVVVVVALHMRDVVLLVMVMMEDRVEVLIELFLGVKQVYKV
jgi:hypothetical protein